MQNFWKKGPIIVKKLINEVVLMISIDKTCFCLLKLN